MNQEEIIKNNWNRMAELSKLHKKSEPLQTEFSYRVNLHNRATSNNKQTVKEAIKELILLNINNRRRK